MKILLKKNRESVKIKIDSFYLIILFLFKQKSRKTKLYYDWTKTALELYESIFRKISP